MAKDPGALRITGGALRGRRLHTPKGEDLLRPMRAQVRQALFNSLGSVEDMVVLDLFTGTGCLGLEALSRGAARAVLVDKARQSLACCRKNVADLGLRDRADVVQHDLGHGVASLASKGPFDLVLVHPPFVLLRGGPLPPGQPDVAELLAAVARTPGLLAAGGWIAFETPRACYPRAEDLPGLTVERRKEYGSTALFLATPAGAPGA